MPKNSEQFYNEHYRGDKGNCIHWTCPDCMEGQWCLERDCPEPGTVYCKKCERVWVLKDARKAVRAKLGLPDLS